MEKVEDFLMHYGIKGQKWGVRRYQNEDGSLTEEGRRRYNTGAPDEVISDGKGGYYYNSVDDKGNPTRVKYKTNISDLTREELNNLNQQIAAENNLNKHVAETQKSADEAKRDVLNESAKVLDATAKVLPTGNGKYIKKDYSNMSDQELRERIARLQLEESYGRLTGDTKYVKSGSEKTREFLQTAGAVVAIGGGVAGLVIKIKDAIGKHNADAELKNSGIDEDDENALEHHGIKGQKWGIRRYQKSDGTLTKEGRLRYGGKTHYSQLTDDEKNDLAARVHQDNIEYEEKKARTKKILIGGAIAAGAIVAAAAWINHKYNKQDNPAQPSVAEKVKTTAKAKPKTESIFGTVVDGPGPNAKEKAKSAFHKKPKTGPTVFDAQFRDIPRAGASQATQAKGMSFISSRGNLLLGMGNALVVRHSDEDDTLEHHGIKGQKWGVRRYQNGDGSLTAEGKIRYRTDVGTKEVLKNTSSYGQLTWKEQLQYQHYGKKAGANKGLLVGMGLGASAGLAKSVVDTVRNPEKRTGRTGQIANRFISNILLGGLGGAFVGSIVGKHIGKSSAKAHTAERGKEYVDALLATPVDRID